MRVRVLVPCTGGDTRTHAWKHVLTCACWGHGEEGAMGGGSVNFLRDAVMLAHSPTAPWAPEGAAGGKAGRAERCAGQEVVGWQPERQSIPRVHGPVSAQLSREIGAGE